MTREELEKKYDLLYEKVKRCRGWQREYQKYHIETDRDTMKRIERELDNMLKEETESRKKKQKEMF